MAGYAIVPQWCITRTTGLIAEARHKCSVVPVHHAENTDGRKQVVVSIDPLAVQRVPRKFQDEMCLWSPRVGKEDAGLGLDGDFGFLSRKQVAFHLLAERGSCQRVG